MHTATLTRASRARGWLGALLVAGLGMTTGAPAATDEADRIAALEKKLDQSLQMIRQLSARVQDLEAQVVQSRAPTAQSPALAQSGAAQSGTKAAVPADKAAALTQAQSATNERVDQLEQQVSQIAASAGHPSEDLGMPMHGFADVGLGNRNAQYPAYKGFDIAELDFFLTPHLGSRTRALFELNFEVGADGAVGVDLERAQIGYQFSDSATVWLGRFHTPFGFYNTAFHHGQEIATSLRRPRFLEFEDHGGVLPAHTVGAWLTGSERLGDAKLTYDIFVGNGQRISSGIVDMNNPGNSHGNTIVGGNVGLVLGGALDGLKVGVNAFTTRIDDQDAAPEIFTRVTNYGTYAVYDTDQWEGFAEFYLFNNEDLTNHTGTHRSDAGFVQLGRRMGRYIPYIRRERAALQQSDDYFAAQRFGDSYYRNAVGMRFDIDAKSALKFEVADTHITDRLRQSFDEALIQYAIRF